MRLVQQGNLKLDGKIVDLLPTCVVKILTTAQTKFLLPEITVRHLMSHTFGLAVGGFPGYSKMRQIPKSYSQEKLSQIRCKYEWKVFQATHFRIQEVA